MKSPASLLILVLLAGLALAACADADLTREAHPGPLVGTSWRVVSINGRSPVAGGEPTMVFAAAQVSGSAGCNHYNGNYRYDPSTGEIAIEQAAMTAMACLDQGRMDVEAAFSTTMTRVTTASMDPQGRLVLTGQGAEIVLAVDAVPA